MSFGGRSAFARSRLEPPSPISFGRRFVRNTRPDLPIASRPCGLSPEYGRTEPTFRTPKPICAGCGRVPSGQLLRETGSDSEATEAIYAGIAVLERWGTSRPNDKSIARVLTRFRNQLGQSTRNADALNP